MNYTDTRHYIKEVKETLSTGREDFRYKMDVQGKIAYPFIVEKNGKDVGCIFLLSSPDMRSGWVDMMHFRVYEQKKGYGSSLLNQLCKLADKHNILLYIFPVVDKGSTMSFEKLREWYSKFGFIATGSRTMERKPNV